MDTVTDSERFYNLILDLFEDADEKEEVNNLLMWWNQYVPTFAFLTATLLSILHGLDRCFQAICQCGIRFVKIVLWFGSRENVLS
jgi:hypothetical protein